MKERETDAPSFTRPVGAENKSIQRGLGGFNYKPGLAPRWTKAGRHRKVLLASLNETAYIGWGRTERS